MHYPVYNDFAIDKKQPTMKGKNGNKIQPGNVLSEVDVQEIRLLYNCKSKTIAEKRYYKLLPKTRLSGHYHALTTQTVEKCWDECNLNSKCKSISFGHSALKCHFYDNDSPSNGSDQHYTSITSKRPFSQRLPKTRLFEHYKNMAKDGIEACWDACLLESECKAITFHHSSSNCFFYNTDTPSNAYDETFTSITSKKGFINIFNSCLNFKFNFEISDILWRGNTGPNCDFIGNDFLTFQISLGNDYRKQCRNTNICRSFTLTSTEEYLNECIEVQISCNAATFYNKKSKNCYLFQDIKTERVKNNNSVLFTRKSLSGTLHCIVLSKKSIKLIIRNNLKIILFPRKFYKQLHKYTY